MELEVQSSAAWSISLREMMYMPFYGFYMGFLNCTQRIVDYVPMCCVI